MILVHVDYLDGSIAELSAEVERVMAPFSDKVELLGTIPGVDRRTAEVLIAEIGADMEQFLTHRHLASWAGMCPGSEESAGKRRSGKTRKGSTKQLRGALTEAACAAARSKWTCLAAQYVRLKGRRGYKKAAVAVGHSILVICCEGCRASYLGRVGVFEVMRVTDEVEALALSRSSAEEIGRAAVKGGMVRMRADGLQQAARGITPIEEILRTTL